MTSPHDLDPVLVGFDRAVRERHLGVEGVHVHVRGRRPVAHRWAADIRRDVFSVSKTVTSLAIGIARSDGLLSLDDAVLDHLPEYASDAAAGVDAMTIRHLLTMTAGIDYRWDDADADHPDDPARDFFATPPIAEPSSTYLYRGTNSYLLGRIIHACSGQDLVQFLSPRLFAPLGIRNPQWHRCPLGFPLGAVGLFLRTEEIARIGETLLDEGSYRGRQLVPTGYVAEMTGQVTFTGRAEPDNERYGLHVWLCSRDGAWRMDGIYGQFSIMLPRHGACITVTSHYRGATTDILDAVWSELVPRLG